MRREYIAASFALVAIVGLLAASVLAVDFVRSRDSQQPIRVAAADPAEQGGFADVVAASPLGGRGEAIEVHGRWSIEIREPDGSLVRIVEFDNALEASAARRLAQLLKASHVVTGWEILLSGSQNPDGSSNSPCFDPSAETVFELGRAACLIVEAQQPATPEWRFNNPTVSVPDSGLTRDKLVLSGTATAHFPGNVRAVSTNILVRQLASGRTFGDVFTSARRDPPEPVQAGQQILVTVVISFR